MNLITPMITLEMVANFCIEFPVVDLLHCNKHINSRVNPKQRNKYMPNTSGDLYSNLYNI